MVNYITKKDIVLYHHSNNIIQDGYMTWFSDNTEYIVSESSIVGVLHPLNYFRCKGEDKCTYVDTDSFRIQILKSKELKLIELHESGINFIEMVFDRQSIIDFLIRNKIDGFYCKSSYNVDSSVYYLFTSNKLLRNGVIEKKKNNCKLGFQKKLIYSFKVLLLSIYSIIVSVILIILILVNNYKYDKQKKNMYIKGLTNGQPVSYPKKVNIMCWNIHYFRDVFYNYTYNDIINYIKYINPETICLQEVYNIPIINNTDITKDLHKLDYKYILHENNTGLLSASKSPPIEKKLVKFNNKRGFIIFEYRDKIIINTHLEVKTEEERVKQIKELLKNIEQINKPILICGDLNTIRREDYSNSKWEKLMVEKRKYMFEPKVIDILEKNGFKDVGFSFKNNINTSYWDRRVDYFFIKNMVVNDYFVDTSNVISDHHPILLN